MWYYLVTLIFLLLDVGSVASASLAVASAATSLEHSHREAFAVVVTITVLGTLLLLFLFFAKIYVEALGEIARQSYVKEVSILRGTCQQNLCVLHVIAVWLLFLV